MTSGDPTVCDHAGTASCLVLSCLVLSLWFTSVSHKKVVLTTSNSEPNSSLIKTVGCFLSISQKVDLIRPSVQRGALRFFVVTQTRTLIPSPSRRGPRSLQLTPVHCYSPRSSKRSSTLCLQSHKPEPQFLLIKKEDHVRYNHQYTGIVLARVRGALRFVCSHTNQNRNSSSSRREPHSLQSTPVHHC